MIKFHQKYFVEPIPFEEVNPDQIRNNNNQFRNLHNIENKLTRFQIYPETELACKYKKPIYKTQYSEILVEYEHAFDIYTGHLIVDPMATSHSLTDGNLCVSVKFQKNIGRIGGKLKAQDADSTRLQELSLINRTYFGANQYDIHLDIKLDYTKSRIFQEMSLSELETLHQLCELERTQILQSLALAVLKIPYAGYLLSGNRSKFIDYDGNILWFTLVPKKYHLYTFLKIKDVTKESPYSTKIKYILLIHSQEEHIYGTQQYHVDQKTAKTLYN